MPELVDPINDDCALRFEIEFLPSLRTDGWVDDGPAGYFASEAAPRMPVQIALGIGDLTYAAVEGLCDVPETAAWLQRLEMLAGEEAPEFATVGFDTMGMPFMEWETQRKEWQDVAYFNLKIMLSSSYLCGGSDVVRGSGPGMQLTVYHEPMRTFVSRLRVQFEMVLEQAGFDPDGFLP